MTKIYPVIHHLDTMTTISEAGKILNTVGVDGIFLISHQGGTAADMVLLDLASAIKAEYPDKKIGANLLTIRVCAFVINAAIKNKLDMVWFDTMDNNPSRLKALADAAMRGDGISIFAPVAFKHQPQETSPVDAAERLRKLGFIPTTSGDATGEAPTVQKVKDLSQNAKRVLAVASGMTPANVHLYKSFLSSILVASGIAMDDDFYRVDITKLEAFVRAVKG